MSKNPKIIDGRDLRWEARVAQERAVGASAKLEAAQLRDALEWMVAAVLNHGGNLHEHIHRVIVNARDVMDAIDAKDDPDRQPIPDDQEDVEDALHGRPL